MGKSIYVGSFEDMAKAAQKLQEISTEYNSIANQLMQAASTMGNAWDGADNYAFVQQITGFTDDLQNMATKVANAGEALAQQKANYVGRQEDNIAQVSKLTN